VGLVEVLGLLPVELEAVYVVVLGEEVRLED
jgi:hypothetical protein